MTIRSILGAAVIAAGALAAAGAGAQQKVDLKFGIVVSLQSDSGRAATAFADEIAKASNGKFNVQIFPSSALGGGREMIEGVQLGTIDLYEGATGPLGNFVPEVQVFDLPFLFRDYPHAYAVLDGPVGQNILAKIRAKGLTPLAWSEVGFRHLTNSRRPVATVNDVRGLKVRTMENPVHIAAWKALGALPTPMAWPDALVGLQQKAIDGQENPAWANLANKMPDVQSYMSLTGHVYSPGIILMSPATWGKLAPAEQAMFSQAAANFRDTIRNSVRRGEEASVEGLRKAGMQVIEVDKTAFQAAMAPVYAEYGKQFGADYVERIRNTR
jgi:tripartite ATP-independent transporter DctP family solute receptor